MIEVLLKNLVNIPIKSSKSRGIFPEIRTSNQGRCVLEEQKVRYKGTRKWKRVLGKENNDPHSIDRVATGKVSAGKKRLVPAR